MGKTEDADPDGKANAICARRRAEGKHDFDEDLLALFSPVGIDLTIEN